MLTSKKSGNALAIDYLEILVLLILPMPFLKLNVIYIILVLLIIFLSRYLRNEKWSNFGFTTIHKGDLIKAVLIGLIFGLVDNYFLEPFLTESLFGKGSDLSSLDDARGNLAKSLVLLLLGWVVGGFFEEFFFRGYLFYRIGTIIKSENWRKSIIILITSTVFAAAHFYQDYSGVFSAFYFSVIMGLLYFYFKKNIWYLILIHGIYDTFGIGMVYFGL